MNNRTLLFATIVAVASLIFLYLMEKKDTPCPPQVTETNCLVTKPPLGDSNVYASIYWMDTAIVRTNDTVYAPVRQPCNYDSVKQVVDSMHYRIVTAEYKIERVKYYIKISENNTANRTFFFGWIKRAVAE